MTPEQWVAEAARVLASFHRASLSLALVLFALTVYENWRTLDTLKGPVGPVLSAALAGYAIPEALFPLYWTLVKSRPVSDIPSSWLEIYVYIGSVLIVLVSTIGIREAWK